MNAARATVGVDIEPPENRGEDTLVCIPIKPVKFVRRERII